jgi:hypothetical protein
MAAMYRTFIANLVGALPDMMAWQIQIYLADLFTPCVKGKFDNNWVYFADPKHKPEKHELLVYFMPPYTSIIKHAPRAGAPDFTKDGNTVFGSGASEVYVNSTDPQALANLAFHELMHNRLKSGAAMHSQGGLASPIVYSNTQITTANINAMAKVISAPIKQWTHGITLLANGKRDPGSEYYKAF